jgi:hypothetical protein
MIRSIARKRPTHPKDRVVTWIHQGVFSSARHFCGFALKQPFFAQSPLAGARGYDTKQRGRVAVLRSHSIQYRFSAF